MNSTEPLPVPYGIVPFVFEPHVPDQEVAAFGRTFRALAWAVLAGLAAWVVRTPSIWQSDMAWWAGSAWLMMAITVVAIQRSRTRLNAQVIEQRWLWRKSMPVQELAFAKLMWLPALDWLIAPRLYVRNLTGKFAILYCADRAVLQDMQRLCAELQAFRTLAQ